MEWSYSFEKPEGNWYQPGAVLSSWKKGDALFGGKRFKNGASAVHTEWNTSGIWIARKFNLPEGKLTRPFLRIAYDEDPVVFINGVKALSLKE